MPPVQQKAKTPFEEIQQLYAEASNADADYRDKLAEADEALQRREELLQQAEQLHSQLRENDGEVPAPQPMRPTARTATPSRPTTRPSGPVRKTATTATTSPQPKHGTRPINPALAKKPVVAVKTQPQQRNYDNDTSLPETVWDVLDREPGEYKSLIENYPDEGAVGLKVAEIKDVIELEKKWVSSSPNISPMIQSVVGDLRYEGKLARNEDDRRYYIIDGAELYGSPLNADGTPMEETEEGTFIKSDGQVFMDPQGRPIKKRRKKSE
jgi:hypothetical protein